MINNVVNYSKTCLKGSLKKDPKICFKTNGGGQWLSGRVLDWRPNGPQVQASPASLRCGP